MAHEGQSGGPQPIIIGVLKAMQGRSEHIVKLVQIFGGHQFVCIKEAWKLLEFLDDDSLISMQQLSYETNHQIKEYLADFLSQSMGI